MKKILILTSGNISKLDAFSNKVVKASFDDINFTSGDDRVFVGKSDLSDFDAVYFRLVGKSLEIATLVVFYAKENRIKIVDNLYTKSQLIPISQSKLLELRQLEKSGIPIPRTYFGNMENLNYPYVYKSTTGQKAREVWLINSKNDLPKKQSGKFYFAQQYIPNAHRIRVLVVGDKVVGAVVRQTKWNKDETKKTLKSVPYEISDLAIKSAKACNIQICGVDILVNTKTGKKYVIEANAAPSWKLINKYCGVSVEKEIVKYLYTL